MFMRIKELMNKKGLSKEEIEAAKQVSLTLIYSGVLHKVGKTLRGSCPFHNDVKTPNFHIYPKTNSWYCFRGCGGGDVIKFYMILKQVGFKQAVEELSHV